MCILTFKVELPVIKRAKLVEHDDLDAEDADDPMMVSEYVNEIFEYLLVLEVMQSDEFSKFIIFFSNTFITACINTISEKDYAKPAIYG